jgi:hypothetical protein
MSNCELSIKDFRCLRDGEPLFESELHEAVKERRQFDRQFATATFLKFG